MLRWFFWGLAAAVLTSGCATYKPTWTPETAAPPATPPAAIQAGAPIEVRAKPVAIPEQPAAPVPILRDSAILTAIMYNKGIEIARLGPQIGQTLPPEARAQFDPSFLASFIMDRENRELSTGDGLSASSGGGSGGGAGGDAIQDTITLLSQTRRLLSVLHAEDTLEVDNNMATASLLQHLPTGTRISVSGVSGSVDSNLTDRVEKSGVTVGVGQPLLEGAGLAVNLVALRQAENRAAQSEFAFRDEVLALVRNVEINYWELSLAYEVLGIRRFAVQLAEEQLRRNEELMRVGKIIEGDVIAARAERASRIAEQTEAEATLRNRTLAMVQLLNPPAAQRWDLQLVPQDKPEVAPVQVDPEASERLAMQYRPDLAQARLDLANSDLDVLRTKNQLLPRLDIVGSYSTNDVRGGTSRTGGTALGSLSGSDTDQYTVGFEVEQPILNRGEKARYRRARLLEKQASETIENLEQSISRQVRQAGVEVEAIWQRIQATHEALESRTEQLRVAQGRYEVGKITNLDLLIVQRDLIQAQVDDATARARYAEAQTALFASEGTLLERRGISLDLAQNEQ